MLVGANEELCELIKQMTKDIKVNESLVKQGVKWIVNPLYAPHFGWVFETMIKAAKRANSHLRKCRYHRRGVNDSIYRSRVIDQFKITDLLVSESR